MKELFDKRFSEYNYEYFFGKDGKQYKLSEKDLKWIKKMIMKSLESTYLL